jgi:hypothetical protein
MPDFLVPLYGGGRNGDGSCRRNWVGADIVGQAKAVYSHKIRMVRYLLRVGSPKATIQHMAPTGPSWAKERKYSSALSDELTSSLGAAKLEGWSSHAYVRGLSLEFFLNHHN